MRLLSLASAWLTHLIGLWQRLNNCIPIKYLEQYRAQIKCCMINCCCDSDCPVPLLSVLGDTPLRLPKEIRNPGSRKPRCPECLHQPPCTRASAQAWMPKQSETGSDKDEKSNRLGQGRGRRSKAILNKSTGRGWRTQSFRQGVGSRNWKLEGFLVDRTLRGYGQVQRRIKCPGQTSAPSRLGQRPARLFCKFLWTRWIAVFGTTGAYLKECRLAEFTLTYVYQWNLVYAGAKAVLRTGDMYRGSRGYI